MTREQAENLLKLYLSQREQVYSLRNGPYERLLPEAKQELEATKELIISALMGNSSTFG